MLYNFQNEHEVLSFKEKTELFINRGYTVDLIQKKNTRTTKQNSALHLLFTIVSNQLNEMGIQYQYKGLKGQNLETRYTPNIVKQFIWKPIQLAMFDIESTTKINTQQINEIMDVLINFFAERSVVIEFPSKETLRKIIE